MLIPGPINRADANSVIFDARAFSQSLGNSDDISSNSLDQTEEKKGLIERFMQWLGSIEIEYKGMRSSNLMSETEEVVNLGFADIDNERRKAREKALNAARDSFF